MTKIHPTGIPHYDDLCTAAQSVAAMRYDKVAEFLEHLSTEFRLQADGDATRGRVQLANRLAEASQSCGNLAEHFRRTFTLCLPHMAEELALTDDPPRG